MKGKEGTGRKGGRTARTWRDGGAYAPRVLLALCAFALVVAYPATARADVMATESGANVAGYVAPYEYSEWGRAAALCEVLGYDWDSMSSSTQQEILTHDNSDNPFASALRNIRNLAYEPATTLEDVALQDVLQPWSILYGHSNVWYYKLTKANYDACKAYVYQYSVAQPPDSGGGGGGENPGQGSEDITVGSTVYTDWTGGTLSGGNLSLEHVPVDSGSNLNWDVSNLSLTTDRLFFGTYGYNATGVKPRYFNVPTGVRVVTPKTTTGLLYLYNDTNEVVRITYKYTDKICYPDSNNNNIYSIEANRFSNATMTLQPNTLYSLFNIEHINRISRAYYQGTSVIQPTPTPPYTPTPDNGTYEPEAPEPPSGGGGSAGNQPVEINFTLPDISVSWPSLNFTNNTTEPNTTDYTDWLRAIYRAVKEMDTNVQRIGSALDAQIRNVGSIIETVKSAIATASTNLQRNINHQVAWLRDGIKDDLDVIVHGIKGYLRELFTWMGNRIYGIENQMTTKLINWLKRIYNRLGGGNQSPITNPDVGGPWDWLSGLLGEALENITDDADSLKDELLDLLSVIITKFPFCIPWDIALALGLLGGEPVTPVIECDVPYWQDLTYTIEIDLTPYDDAMEVMRNMELLGFAIYLMWRSRDIIGMIDPTEDLEVGK